MCLCLCLKMNRSYAIFRESLKRLPTLDTIYEEVYETERVEPIKIETRELMWGHWQSARDDEWGQWIDVEYIDVICS
jgi:hypothetical protein